ncbi:hypothetical protein OIO90_003507 [Microbotryomycetes sp. JL221]|nr:hypothetical protein OIO90_003507 [Microbotryomycetes sp. JL221]
MDTLDEDAQWDSHVRSSTDHDPGQTAIVSWQGDVSTTEASSSEHDDGGFVHPKIDANSNASGTSYPSVAPVSGNGHVQGRAENDVDDANSLNTPIKVPSTAATKGFKKILRSDYDSPPASGGSSPSNDTFPGFRLGQGSMERGTPLRNGPSTPRRPSAHPQISRLRSMSTQQRFASNSSYSTALEFPLGAAADSPGTSGFDMASRRSSASNIFDLANGGKASSDLVTPSQLSPAATETGRSDPIADIFKWSTLKRVSSKVYPAGSRGTVSVTTIGGTQSGMLGSPTVMSVSGIVAVGTSKGWAMVFDFNQNLRCVCGTEAISKDAGAVTALAVSQDHTFIVVGHAFGSIHLYALSQPSKPARSVPPTTVQMVMTGRKEGHLTGSRILHLGFVGARHTAIVSSDDSGLAFYHSLGRVLMLASTDIIRMLGRYPDPRDEDAANILASNLPMTKKPSTIFDMAALPLGSGTHASDPLSLIALLTPTKLVIVGLKPKPRTWWRALPSKDGAQAQVSSGRDFATSGFLAWCPSLAREDQASTFKTDEEAEQPTPPGEDPVLAFAWERTVRFVRVAKGMPQAGVATEVSFVETSSITCDETILALRWYTSKILVVLTESDIEIWNVVKGQRIGNEATQGVKLVGHKYYATAMHLYGVRETESNCAASFQVHKKKLFLLSLSDVRAGALMSWADRILNLMQPATILNAIELATAYLLGQSDASTIALPDDPVERRQVVEPRVREILNASVAFVFSDDRLRDGTHANGEAIQRLFEGLVGTCVRASLAIGDVDWLFDELYERYEQNGIEAIFLDRLEPFVLSGSVHNLPPIVSQRLIAIHDKRGQYAAAERIIWHVDPENIDVDQALKLCQREKLYDALFYVYTRCIHDYVAPVVELIGVIRQILLERTYRPSRVGETDEAAVAFWAQTDGEALVPDAYRVYQYMSHVFCGESYPRKDALPYEEGIKARTAVYNFVFSPRSVSWPQQKGELVLTSIGDDGQEAPHPYIRLLLRFDSEAMLDCLDLAFEDSYLGDDCDGARVDRQSIVDLLFTLLEDDTTDLSALDRTFLRIFVARNLPKYPQYISTSPARMWDTFAGLAQDTDQSTTDDRQLAAEFLLSVYTPTDLDLVISMLQKAHFHRLLRSIYRTNKRWAALATTYLDDDASGSDLFRLLGDTLRLAAESDESDRRGVVEVILNAVPHLVDSGEDGVQQLATLVDAQLASYHDRVLERLATSSWRQFAYLRFLLEPGWVEAGLGSSDRAASTALDTSHKLLYLSLLCEHEPRHVTLFLENEEQGSFMDEARDICERAEVYDAVVWILDRSNNVKGALDKMDVALESRTDLILHDLLSHRSEGRDEDEDERDGRDPVSRHQRGARLPQDRVSALLEQITAVARVSIDVCSRRSKSNPSDADLPSEELWFRLLSSLVSTVRAVRTVAAPALSRSDAASSSRRRVSGASIILREMNDDVSTAQHVCHSLAGLLPIALSSLVSTVSTRQVSFPQLMRRLIDANSRSPSINGSYAEFKAIVTSMLDSFVSEGDLLELTSKVTAQDLFEYVEHLRLEREKGWRAGSDVCEECLQPVWGRQGQGSPPVSRSASVSIMVNAMGTAERPGMKKRPSIKGKEVEWPGPDERKRQSTMEPPRGIVIGRDGRLWHQMCHLSNVGRL